MRANGGEGESYFHKKTALIKGWRELWGYDFPFYFVQLANFQRSNDNPAGGDGYAKVREAQRKTLTIPKTGMAVIIDIGMAGNIHPPNKQDVGKRLAYWALADEFGKKIVKSGPLFKEMKIKDGKAVISFDSIGSGLMVGEKKGLEPTKEIKDGKLKRFAIAGEDKKWVWGDAVIDGKNVVVSSADVPNPVAVRYAFSMNPEGCNLYNKEGIPASPFRTDDW